MSKKAVVLLSGGLDSTTALYWAKARGFRVQALSLLYGQRHGRELKSARAVAKSANVLLAEVRLELPWLKTSSLVNSRKPLPNLPLSKIGRAIPSTYVPGRNTVFLALAASLADAAGAEAIIIGANHLDYSGYPDCRPQYLKAFSDVARKGTRRGAEGRPLRVLAPLLSLDKKEIIELEFELKAPLSLTWSCYRGGKTPCGRCDSCKLRAKGFAEAKLSDPALC